MFVGDDGLELLRAQIKTNITAGHAVYCRHAEASAANNNTHVRKQ
jgi:hypothetical protein